MSVACFLGTIVAAAFGVWWLAIMLLIAGIALAAIDSVDRRSRRRFLARQRCADLIREIRHHDRGVN